jgi:hypothetical protein
MIAGVNMAYAQQANFTGQWVINENKSDFAGQSPATMFKTINVIQTADSLKIKGLRFGSDNGLSTVISYPLNGEPKIIVLSGNRKMTATLSWQNNGRSIVRSSVYFIPNQPGLMDYESKETWSLSDDLKVLVLSRVFTIRNRKSIAIKAIYEKQ